jgi:5-methylthioadenosine/S-adenosylhomocysteine deaminase
VSVSLRDVLLPDGRTTNVHVEGNRIAEVGPKREADVTIDGRGKALVPGFVNAHTHAAMTLLRGYADDMPLQDWLSTRIWPAERRITPDAIYWGTKLACVEMVKSGTTCFNDMYFHTDRAAKAVQETGIRAVLSEGFIDLSDPGRAEEQFRQAREAVRRIEAMRCDRVVPALGPHGVYTVSGDSLREMRRWADEAGRLIHIHVSETRAEVEGARKDHGKTPVEYLDALGVLGPDVVAAHSVWLEEAEIRTLAGRGVSVAHCPVSNMKLAVGRAMPLAAMQAARVNVSLGTDGAASNNNLDMFQTMKVAALLHKFAADRPTVATAREVFAMATVGGARALHLDAGSLEVGKLADLVLLDLRRAEMTPTHDLVSNVVYAAGSDCVDTVLCDGRVVMEGRRVPGEAEILENAAREAAKLVEAR